MKLDSTDEQKKSVVVKKKQDSAISNSQSANSILDLLNPLKSVNINSSLHSFYNFRETKESVEALLKAQQNLIFYVLHQNFMCDAEHKEFFKNMVGRFYDLPQKYWDYYRGVYYIENTDVDILTGLILTENGPLYEKTVKGDLSFLEYDFKANNQKTNKRICFNGTALNHLHGIYNKNFTLKFNISSHSFHNKGFYIKSNYYDTSTNTPPYEMYRFETNLPNRVTFGYWDIINKDNFKDIFYRNNYDKALSLKSLYASIGIEDHDKTKEKLKELFQFSDREYKEELVPNFSEENKKMIRSLYRENLSKEHIINNTDQYNLDVLGLNMYVPWDMELVKFFIERGYGGRMSENKAVYDKVFKPLLTDEVLDMIFKLEYEKY